MRVATAPSIDDVRAFWDRRPCNVRHSAQPRGSRAYFDEVERRKYFVEPHIPAFADFPRWAGKQVLEVGCGIGTDTVNFARFGADLTAVDLSPESLALTRRRLEVFALEADLRLANAENLSQFPDGAFDLVYSFGVLHHTPNPAAAFAECRRVLKPGGELRVMVYNAVSYKTLWGWLQYIAQGRGWRWRDAIRYYAEAQADCPVAFTYTNGEAAELVAPLELVSLRNDHIFPYVIKDYIQYRYRKVWYFRVLPRPMFRTLERTWGWHKLIVARKPGIDATESGSTLP